MSNTFCRHTKLVFDLEANSLDPDIIWGAGFACELCNYAWWEAEEAFVIGALERADMLIGHNIMGYDFPALKQVWGWEPLQDTMDPEAVFDTFEASIHFYPNRPLKGQPVRSAHGAHSVEAWAQVLHLEPKVVVPDDGWNNPESIELYAQRGLQDAKLERDIFRYIWKHEVMK